MLTCIILNYNDANHVLKLYNKIKDYKVLNHIIIVDNASTDNSYQQLKRLSNKNVTVLLSDKNGGYGYGNNIGLRYSQKLGATYSLIVNPDVDFEEKVIVNCLKILKNYDNVVAIAPKIAKTKEYAFRIVPAFRDFLSTSLLLNKIFKPRLYPKKYFENKKIMEVDALVGSLVLFDFNKFLQCGFYDENVFLYNEEIIIANKFKQKGYISLLNLADNYKHYHGGSVNKEVKSIIRLKRIGLKSHYYYLRHYCNASLCTLFIFKIIVPFTIFEYIVYLKLKKIMSWI